MDAWLGNRKRILVLNREDMISTKDRNAWANYFTRQGVKVVFSNGQLGMVLNTFHFGASINLLEEEHKEHFLFFCPGCREQ